MKCFNVEQGHDVQHRGAWYGPGVLLILEPGDDVDVYAAPGGVRGTCVGSYRYSQLDPNAPPQGLCCVQPEPARAGKAA